MPAAPTHAISLRDVQLIQGDTLVLEHVNVDIRPGEFVYVIGKTGSGKSSFLRALYADLPISRGQARVAGYDLTTIRRGQIPFLRRKLGLVFQDFELLYDRTVEENMLFVLSATGWTERNKMRKRIDEMLDAVGLGGISQKRPHQLSGGEQQRVAIARALLNHPEMLIADEPTGNLDPAVAYEILDLFVRIHQAGTTVVIATHQHHFLRRFPERVLFCRDRQLLDVAKAQVLERLQE